MGDVKGLQGSDAWLTRGLAGLVFTAGLACGVPEVAPRPSALEVEPEQLAELPPLSSRRPLARPYIAFEQLSPMPPPQIALEAPRAPALRGAPAPDLEEEEGRVISTASRRVDSR